MHSSFKKALGIGELVSGTRQCPICQLFVTCELCVRRLDQILKNLLQYRCHERAGTELAVSNEHQQSDPLVLDQIVERPLVRIVEIAPTRAHDTVVRKIGCRHAGNNPPRGVVSRCLFGVHILVRGTVRAEPFPHLVLLATLHVVSQPQPRFCHVQENQLVRKVNNFRAGIPIRNLAAGFDA
jgi:hypothetical protein